MKKMIKKVIVAVLAMAMALGMMTVATSAEPPKNKTVYLVVDDEDTSKYAMHFWHGVTTDAVTANIGWGDTELKPVFTKVQDGLLKMEVTVWSDIKPQGENGIQIVSFETVGSNTGEYKACSEDGKNTYWSDVYNAFAGTETEIWLALDSWTIKTTTPVAITKTPAEIATEAIAAIGTVALTDECDAKIKAAKNAIDACGSDTSGITNLSTYTAAKAEWNTLVADGAGIFNIHVKSEWDTSSLYVFFELESGKVEPAGGWPGKATTENANNEGWADVSVEADSVLNLILNGGGKQTADIKYYSADEYWFEVDAEGKYTVSTTAPTGWSTGAVTPPPADEEDESKEDESKEDESKEDESKEDTSKEDESKEDTSKEDESKEDESKEDESKEDTSKEDESKEDESKEDTNTYHVAGEAGLCGEAWNPAKNQMTKNADGTWSIKFTNVKAGTYAFKVATNGAWNNGEYNLEGDASNEGPNASITVEEDGSTVIISFDGEKAIITMNEVPEGTGEDTPAGDNSMVAIFAILAVLAAAGVVTVVVAKRRAIEE